MIGDEQHKLIIISHFFSRIGWTVLLGYLIQTSPAPLSVDSILTRVGLSIPHMKNNYYGW
jgi:hypothetical protein